MLSVFSGRGIVFDHDGSDVDDDVTSHSTDNSDAQLFGGFSLNRLWSGSQRSEESQDSTGSGSHVNPFHVAKQHRGSFLTMREAGQLGAKDETATRPSPLVK